MPEMKPQVVQYNKKTYKPKTRLVTPKDVQECLEDMGLDCLKYNRFRNQLQKHQCMNMLDKIGEI